MNFYRYHTSSAGLGGVGISIEHFTLLRETPKGYWVIPDFMRVFSEREQEERKRWISKTSRKRYCYPSKAEAWESFKHRKAWQLHHLTQQMKRCQAVIDYLDTSPDVPIGNVTVRRGSSFDLMDFE